MLTRLYLPSPSGDYRLVADPDNPARSLLEVVDPTPAEVKALSVFLRDARSRGWADDMDGVARLGASRVFLLAPVEEIGPVLLAQTSPPRGKLAVVTSTTDGALLAAYASTDGEISSTALIVQETEVEPAKGWFARLLAFLSGEKKVVPSDDSRVISGEEAAEEQQGPSVIAGGGVGGDPRIPVTRGKNHVRKKKKAHPVSREPEDSPSTQAVVVPRPFLSARGPGDCPDTRASEVLERFSTTAQWATWSQHGWMRVLGGRSGHVYRLCHRRTPAARHQGAIAWDCDDGLPMRASVWTLPPAEEVLALKLYLEHAEPWVRNSRGIDRGTSVFTHPMGQTGAADGIADQAFLAAFEGGVRAGFLAPWRRLATERSIG